MASRFFKVCRGILKFFYGKYKFIGVENIPESGALVIGNHCLTHGPIMSECFFPGDNCTWSVSNMLDRELAKEYAYNDFWKEKKPGTEKYYRFACNMLGPILAWAMTNADTIPVYHDARLMTTFRCSAERINGGTKVVLFPENENAYSNIVNDFERHFVDVAAYYYRKYGEAIPFLPIYIAPKVRTVSIGKPIMFDPENPIAEERERVCAYLKQAITELAHEMPVHVVVPFRPQKGVEWGTNK